VVLQAGPGRYVAAIRADDTVGAWDGFYFSRSTDGLRWSAPEPFGDVGREPLVWRVDDQWVLTYRQYVQAERTQYSAVRLSRDGMNWSRPYRIESGVDSGATLLQVGDELIALNQRYPDRRKITRHVIDLDRLVSSRDRRMDTGP
jgi:hypothetical protein